MAHNKGKKNSRGIRNKNNNNNDRLKIKKIFFKCELKLRVKNIIFN